MRPPIHHLAYCCCTYNTPKQGRDIRIHFGEATRSADAPVNVSCFSSHNRFEDIYLVAARLRCSVLLDSRRAPRSAQPFSEILLKLQANRKADRKDHDAFERQNEEVASLGLLHLEDSCFLINRQMLREKLDDALLSSPMSDRMPGSMAALTHVIPTSGRNMGLLDVRGTLAAPQLCVKGALRNQLHAALGSVFGYSASHLNDPTSTEAPPICWSRERGRGNPSSPRVTIQSKVEFETGGSEGVRWLRDWKSKELFLNGKDIRERLGNVGMSGLAGWLLEYPVTYCCPSPSEGERGPGDYSWLETSVAANCLAGTPLVVYTLHFEFTRDDSKMSDESRSSFDAFSFSIPESVQIQTGCTENNDTARVREDEEGANTPTILHSLVNNFLETFEARVARHNEGVACTSYYRDHKRRALHMSVKSRKETLDRVAL